MWYSYTCVEPVISTPDLQVECKGACQRTISLASTVISLGILFHFYYYKTTRNQWKQYFYLRSKEITEQRTVGAHHTDEMLYKLRSSIFVETAFLEEGRGEALSRVYAGERRLGHDFPIKEGPTWTSQMAKIMDPILPTLSVFWDSGPWFWALLEVQERGSKCQHNGDSNFLHRQFKHGLGLVLILSVLGASGFRGPTTSLLGGIGSRLCIFSFIKSRKLCNIWYVLYDIWYMI